MGKEIKNSVSKQHKKNVEETVIDDGILEKELEVREVVVERKTGFNYLEVIIIMIITLILGVVIGSFVTYVGKSNKSNGVVSNQIPSEFREFFDAYNNISNDYYEDINQKELIEAGIKGMLEYLGDDYSVFLDNDASEDFNEQVEGKYTGVGVQIAINSDNRVQIYQVFANSPAAVAGLKVGDVFLKVNGENVKKKNTSEISSLIKNSDKKTVEVTILRDGVEKKFDLVLKEVEIESVTSKVFNKNNKKIGYIGINIFAANTYEQFERTLLVLEGQNIDDLVIDVRDNSGGYLNCVTSIASLFLNKNKVIYKLDTKGLIEPIYSTSNTNRKYNIAVLINNNSASASEILAAALKESYNARVVGVNSYGKGTVQRAYQLESGATVKYTIQKWLTPDGNWINEVGVEPTDKVELSTEYFAEPTDDNDNQLQRALDLLSEK